MGPKILTVDDSKTIRMIVGRAFKSFACEIHEAADGVEGKPGAGGGGAGRGGVARGSQAGG